MFGSIVHGTGSGSPGARAIRPGGDGWRLGRPPPGRPGPRPSGRVEPRPGRTRLEFQGLVLSLEIPRIEAFLAASRLDLGLDPARRSAWVRGRRVDLRAWEIPFAILVALAEAEGERVESSVLFARAWGRPARNEYDLRAVYLHVWRLRRALDPEGEGSPLIMTDEGGYRLRPAARVAWIRTSPVPEPGSEAREPEEGGAVPAGAVSCTEAEAAERILAMARTEGVVEPRRIERKTGRSRSWVGRLLRRLTQRGVLERVGQGRSTGYRIAA